MKINNCDVADTLSQIVDKFNSQYKKKSILGTKQCLDSYNRLLKSNIGTIFYNEENIIRYMNMVNQHNSIKTRSVYEDKT